MRYTVKCKNLLVGTHVARTRGEEMEASEFPSGTDFERLLRLGAIVPTRGEFAEPAPESGQAQIGGLELLTRKELDARATTLGIDSSKMGSKALVIAAILEAGEAGEVIE